MRPLHPRTALPALLLALASCTTVESSQPIWMDDVLPAHCDPVRLWSLEQEGEPIGFVVQFEPRDADVAGFFSVRNRFHQDLGMIDALGRAWRYVAHERDAQWLGSGTVLEGAGRILGAGSLARMEELPLRELAATPGP